MKSFLILIAMAGFVACSHSPTKDKWNSFHGPDPISENLQLLSFKDISFSGQPNKADWETLKKSGYKHIVNLRTSSEVTKGELENLKNKGFVVSHIPLAPAEKLTPEKVKTITKAIVKNRALGKTLVHCSSGNRAAYWAGAHFYLDHKYSKADALTAAKKLGLTKPKKEQQLLEFIDQY